MSAFFHSTVSPAFTVSSAGWNLKLLIVTTCAPALAAGAAEEGAAGACPVPEHAASRNNAGRSRIVNRIFEFKDTHPSGSVAVFFCCCRAATQSVVHTLSMFKVPLEQRRGAFQCLLQLRILCIGDQYFGNRINHCLVIGDLIVHVGLIERLSTQSLQLLGGLGGLRGQ